MTTKEPIKILVPCDKEIRDPVDVLNTLLHDGHLLRDPQGVTCYIKDKKLILTCPDGTPKHLSDFSKLFFNDQLLTVYRRVPWYELLYRHSFICKAKYNENSDDIHIVRILSLCHHGKAGHKTKFVDDNGHVYSIAEPIIGDDFKQYGYYIKDTEVIR